MTTCEACQRPVPAGYLCESCRQDLGERLEQLPALHAALGELLVPSRRAAEARGGPAVLVVSPAPADIDAIEARGEFGVLEVWARACAEDRKAPVPAAEDGAGARVTAACASLRAALDWIASTWPAAGDCAREVGDLHAAARQMTGAADLPARMGRCPQLVHGSPCGAELLLPDGQQVLHCRWCGATYPPGVWAALRVAQRAADFSSEAAPAAAAARPSRA